MRRVTSGDRTIRLWDLRQPNAPLLVLQGDQGSVNSVALSGDGTRLASGSEEGTIRLWDLRQLKAAPLVLETHQGAVNSLAFSGDGTRLASGGRDGTIRLWDLRQTNVEPLLLHGDSSLGPSVAFSGDGARLASGGGWGGTIRVWDLRHPNAAPLVRLGAQNVHKTVKFCVHKNSDLGGMRSLANPRSKRFSRFHGLLEGRHPLGLRQWGRHPPRVGPAAVPLVLNGDWDSVNRGFVG